MAEVNSGSPFDIHHNGVRKVWIRQQDFFNEVFDDWSQPDATIVDPFDPTFEGNKTALLRTGTGDAVLKGEALAAAPVFEASAPPRMLRAPAGSRTDRRRPDAPLRGLRRRPKTPR
ncbi:MAG: hypothetical protein AAGM38_00130 [Pseudomonadota bacterium]